MHSLTRLRVHVYKKEFDGSEKYLIFRPNRIPNLRVLELNVSCNMTLYIDARLALQSLVVLAAGTLRLYDLRCDGPQSSPRSLKSMYLRLDAPLQPCYKAALEHFPTRAQWAGKRLLKSIKEEQSSWTARKPATFQPGSLQELLLRRVS